VKTKSVHKNHEPLNDHYENGSYCYQWNAMQRKNAMLNPAMSLECDGGTVGNGSWGRIEWTPTASQQYYLVADGIVPAADPGHMPEGAFSVSIVHDGDPANPTWLTTEAPVAWNDVETALLASDIRVASVVTLRDAMTMPSDGNLDARFMALATDALTKDGGQWVTELASSSGVGLEVAVSDTIALARTDRHDLALVGFLGSRVGDHDARRGLALLIQALDDHPIVQWTNFHKVS